MSLFIEKYKPNNLNEVVHNQELIYLIGNILNNKENIPNILIYGPDGSGKQTILRLVLKELYGTSIINSKIETFEIKSKKINLNYNSSSYHIEIDMRLYKQWDKYIVDFFLKSIVYTKNIAHNIHKIIIILHAENLSKQSQYALRRIIEKTKLTARYIFTTNSLSKIADPIRSRFQTLRLRSPNNGELSLILKDICKKEKLKLSKPALNKLLNDKPNGIINLKYTINLLQLSFINGKFKKHTYNYVNYMKKMLRYMDCKPSDLTVSRIDKIREHLYTLKIKQIESKNVIKYILSYFLNKEDITDLQKINICKKASELEHRMKNGNKDPLYIENMYYSIMNIIYNS